MEMRLQNLQKLFIRKSPTFGLEFEAYKVCTRNEANHFDLLVIS